MGASRNENFPGRFPSCFKEWELSDWFPDTNELQGWLAINARAAKCREPREGWSSDSIAMRPDVLAAELEAYAACLRQAMAAAKHNGYSGDYWP
jgi:hypothetical protein